MLRVAMHWNRLPSECPFLKDIQGQGEHLNLVVGILVHCWGVGLDTFNGPFQLK